MVNEEEAAAHNLNNPDHAVGGGNSSYVRPPKPLVMHGGDGANNWKVWLQQYQWFEIASNINQKPQNVQVATFMSTIGTEAVLLFNTFGCTPDELGSLDAIKLRFNTYFTPKINLTYERFQFNRMNQEDGEIFDDFLTRIKAQSAKCEFGALHDSLLMDKIVIGIHSETVREQLLAQDDLTLDRVTQKCRASELACKQLRSLKDDSSTVHAIKKNTHSNNRKNKNTSQANSENFDCKRCGTKHGPKSCPAFNKKCEKCERKGHVAEMCRSASKPKSNYPTQSKNPTKKVHIVDEDQSSDVEFYINSIEDDKPIRTVTNRDDERNWFEEIQVEKVPIKVKLDTGAQCNVISKELAKKIGVRIKDSRTKRIITYGGQQINVNGEILAKTKVRGQLFHIKFIVVDQNVSPVLGKNSCEQTDLILRVKEISANQQVFEGLGCLKNFEYDIDFIENPQFEVHAARRIPHAYRQMVKDELDSMVKHNVIREVTEATPAVSPMVVVKQRGKIRICIDPTDVNKNVIRRHYPLKTLEEIAARITGSKIFSKLDCKKGFWQIKLSERTQKFLTFATPWGRYSCTKLPFGLCSAPEIFQQIMTKLLTGIEKAEASMDDILIYAADKEELDKTTAEVMKRIKNAGLTLNKEKCEFHVSKIKFLGHMLSARGVEVDPEKVEAISKLREPDNKTELQRILGMVTYLAKFIPNLSQITQPMRKLLEKDAEWIWTPHQSKSFRDIKDALSTPPVLRFYDVNMDVKLQADASSYALGAAILQENQPVAYSSRSLTKAELNYPQIEKEALAIRFACLKFHEYIYGKKLTVETDHKPLESIFKKPISSAPPRLQRILLDIAPYSPNVVYIKGETMYIADTLSRDCDNSEPSITEEFEVLAFLAMSENAANRMRKASELDETHQQLRKVIQEGWPEKQEDVTNRVKPFWNFRDHITEYDGLLLKGHKVIIPEEEKQTTLNQLHTGHQGVQRTLAVARNYVFWLNMTKDITDHIQKCSVCEATQRSNTTEPLIVREIPNYPFQIVATDLFKFQSNDFLLIVDSYSGFFDFRQLRHSTSKEVIENLKSWFATHGIPEKLDSDNGPQYSSMEFRNFANEWGIQHATSSPKYPKSNGLAERFVQTAKNMLRKCTMDKTDFKLALLNYRNTPRNEVLGSPNQRLMSRTTRSTMPVSVQHLKPQVIENVSAELKCLRKKQKLYHDRNTRPARELAVGDNVRLQQSPRNWTNATVTQTTNQPRSFIVRTDNNGKEYRRNTSQLHVTNAKKEQKSNVVPSSAATSSSIRNVRNQQGDNTNPNALRTPEEESSPASAVAEPTIENTVPHLANSTASPSPVQQLRRSTRTVKKVVKMNL